VERPIVEAVDRRLGHGGDEAENDAGRGAEQRRLQRGATPCPDQGERAGDGGNHDSGDHPLHRPGVAASAPWIGDDHE